MGSTKAHSIFIKPSEKRKIAKIKVKSVGYFRVWYQFYLVYCTYPHTEITNPTSMKISVR